MSLRLAVSALALAAATACYGLDGKEVAQLDTHCGRAPDKIQCMRQEEAASLASPPGVASRSGLKLTIQTRAGPILFTDRPDAGDQTLVHIYRGQLGSTSYHLVERLAWEGLDYVLVSELSGSQTALADVPYVSKSGKRAVSIRTTEEDDSSEIAIWSITPERITREVRLSTAGDPFYYFLFWESDSALRLEHRAFSDPHRCPKTTYIVVNEELKLVDGKWTRTQDFPAPPVCVNGL
jgi:hypothetical protein